MEPTPESKSPAARTRPRRFLLIAFTGIVILIASAIGFIAQWEEHQRAIHTLRNGGFTWDEATHELVADTGHAVRIKSLNPFRSALLRSGVRVLRLQECELKTLSGLEGATDLKKLILSKNAQLRNLSALRSLRSLEDLDTDFLGEDIHALKSLTHLRNLKTPCYWTAPSGSSFPGQSPYLVGIDMEDLIGLPVLKSIDLRSAYWSHHFVDHVRFEGSGVIHDMTLFENFGEVATLEPIAGLALFQHLLIEDAPLESLSVFIRALPDVSIRFPHGWTAGPNHDFPP